VVPNVITDAQIDCLSEVMYAYDKGTHHGIVSFATPAVFAYLYERRQRFERGYPPELVDLYFLLLPRNPPVRLANAPAIISDQFEPHDNIEPAKQSLYDINPPASQPPMIPRPVCEPLGTVPQR